MIKRNVDYSKIKIFNLNIWNYTNFENRKKKIIDAIRKENPDIIAFQEIRDSVEFNKKGNNQLKQLNESLNYPFSAFYPVTDKRKERPEKYKKYCIEGSGILSRIPIEKIEKIKLKKHRDDRYNCGNLLVRINLGKNKKLDFMNVHFSNNSYFSLLHLLETLRQIEERKIQPIIIGDFNMYESEVLIDVTNKKYKTSINYKKYVSYPAKKYTLDYILIPKKFKFKSLKCLKNNLSDHRALVAEVELK